MSKSSYNRNKRWSNNCAQLADFLEALPANRHSQSMWVRPDYECGTVGCAMGWAAMSGEIEGLSFTRNGPGYVTCVVEGRAVEWEPAARRFFGPSVYNNVFLDLHASKDATVAKLRAHAKVYCDAAAAAKARMEGEDEP